MTTVIAFLLGMFAGAMIVFLLIVSTYGTDGDDYYEN